MEVYLARQPIFDGKCRVAGYELLYRDAANPSEAQFVDSDKATCRLLSDAITVFGLPNLTNGKPAYVNFTDNLILNDFVRLAKPSEVVVELLENVRITETLLEKLKYLKRQGYRLALDDYTGGEQFRKLLPIVDVVKVDFRLTDPQWQQELARDLSRYRRLMMLAEKVETQKEFERAVKLGFRLFQGYYFEKPVTLKQKRGSLVESSYMRLLMELNRPDGVDFTACANIIHADASLTYRIIRRVRKLDYYRGHLITAIQQALVVMGVDEVRRWTLLALARDNNVTQSDELVRRAYLRGAFAKRLIHYGPEKGNEECGFLLGMFSMLDQILNEEMEDLLRDVELPKEVAQALLREEDNYYSHLLRYITVYESGNSQRPFPDIGISLTEREVSRLYMDSMVETDQIFNLTEGAS